MNAEQMTGLNSCGRKQQMLVRPWILTFHSSCKRDTERFRSLFMFDSSIAPAAVSDGRDVRDQYKVSVIRIISQR